MNMMIHGLFFSRFAKSFFRGRFSSETGFTRSLVVANVMMKQMKQMIA